MIGAMGNAPVAQYGESGGFLNRIMARAFFLGNPMISLQLLVSSLVRRPSESWEITHYSRSFPVIVVLTLCWKVQWTWRTQLLAYRHNNLRVFQNVRGRPSASRFVGRTKCSVHLRPLTFDLVA